jgi:hypothetical protein
MCWKRPPRRSGGRRVPSGPFGRAAEQAAAAARGRRWIPRRCSAPDDFDELAAAGHDDVGVDLGVLVLDVVQVEQRLPLEEADADGGDGVGERVLAIFLASRSFWMARRAAR